MTPAERFLIYNASAGSGKTFQIAKHYLKKIIEAQEHTYIHRLLGITFTNKASAEMKHRILKNLIAAAEGKILDVMQAVSNESEAKIKNQIGTDDDEIYQRELVKRSRRRLKEILHRYDDFQLTTIDKMMFRLVKTFARDMKLPVDVEVVLDQREVISNLIDKLIARAKKGNELTEFFIELAKQKVDDEKIWDIKNNLIEIDKIIYDDNFFEEIKSLSGKSLADFKALKKNLKRKKLLLEKEFKKIGEEGVEIKKPFESIFKHNIGSFYNYFLSGENISNIKIGIRLSKSMIKAEYYTKKGYDSLTPPGQMMLENVNEELHFHLMKTQDFLDYSLGRYLLLKGLLEELNALSIQKALLDEIEQYKAENHVIFIKDFNSLILNEILKNLEGDTPYIYMRLGEKYSHYFIDEFQDTSSLQWKNLIPLIREALSKEFSNGTQGDIMLVGDAKQSIYRFRAGKPEQFIALSDENLKTGEGNPFYPITNKKIDYLNFNWRSLQEIVQFNNSFFEDFPNYITNKSYQKVYENVLQKMPDHADKKGGYIQLRFMDKEETYAELIYAGIQQAQSNGFSLEDICILINRKTEGYQIAELLTEKNIDIVSDETLLVANALKVDFIVNFIKFVENGDSYALYEVLKYLAERDGLNKQNFYKEVLSENQTKDDVFKSLMKFNYKVDYEQLVNLNIFDFSVYIIHKFKLDDDEREQAYLETFMANVHQFHSMSQGMLRDFLLHWDNVREKLSINISKRSGTVSMMTVHKAKGLEFPVVIYFAETDLISSKDKTNRAWVKVDTEACNNFEQLPIKLKYLEQSDVHQNLYLDLIEERKFDNLNKLYVALTRASEQLFIITKLTKAQQENKPNAKESYASLFKKFVDKQKISSADETGNIYVWGNPKKNTTTKTQEQDLFEINKLLYQNWQIERDNDLLRVNTQSFERWSEEKKSSVLYGILIHDILSKVSTKEDYLEKKDKYLSHLNENEKTKIDRRLTELFEHAQLASYFTSDYQILNERAILIPSGQKFTQKRPDRILLKDNQVVIIDYKTGIYKASHLKQINEYAEILENMGYEISAKLLVYISEEISVVEVN